MANAAIKLNSGHKMPMLGLGVWWADPGVLHNVVFQALKHGFRHFDCACLSVYLCLLHSTFCFACLIGGCDGFRSSVESNNTVPVKSGLVLLK
jgi:hypothetical protein